MESTYFGRTASFADIADVKKRGDAVLDSMYVSLDAYCHGVNLHCLRSVPAAFISEVGKIVTF
jgi:hypothetical protein